MTRNATILAALCAALLLPGPVNAGPEQESLYAPVPPDIAAVIVSENDRALAKMALDTLALAHLDRQAPGSRDTARAQLVMLEHAGLRGVAVRLADDGVPARAVPDLLQVVASSAHPDADILLERAARESRPVLRMIAADGLGRGRTARAVPVLETLARDDVPAVRIAALRSLFAIESPQARAARAQVPSDEEPQLLTARLRWHRRAEDAWPALRDIATEAYAHGRSVPLRIAAAELLAFPPIETPLPILLDIVREMGTNALVARLFRMGRGLPTGGYDPVDMRRIAIEAALTLLEREDLSAPERRKLVERAVWWVARPVAMDPYRKDSIPEHRLRRRLPDLGAEIRGPVVRLLEAGRFAEPRAGALLLREIGAAAALPALRSLVAPKPPPAGIASYADRERVRYVRIAAAGVVQELGRMDDEALARTIIFGDESQALKIDALRSLTRDPGAWVVPLLGEVLESDNRELRSYALDILERRPEPEARTRLIDDLFKHAERPHDRMQPLVRRGDEAGFAILQRALGDERSLLRKAALNQFHRKRNPRLCGEEGRRLLLAHVPNLESPQEIQGYIWALLAVDPATAVAYVQTTWDRFPTNSVRMTALRLLQETRGRAPRHAAIDFALTHAGPSAPAQMLLSVGAVLKGYWTYRTEDVARFWRRMLASEELRWEAIRALAFRGAPDVTAVLLPMLAAALERKPQDEESSVDQQEFVRTIVEALPFQPWPRVESVVIDIAVAPLNEPGTRFTAAQSLFGRLTEVGRTRLMAWMGDTSADSSNPAAFDEPAVQLHLAAAVGEGASPAQAGALQAMLKRELLAFYSNERLARLDVETLASIDANAPRARTMALARAIAHTRHEPTITGLLDLVFDLRFARYARTSIERQRASLTVASLDAAGRAPSSINELAHRDANRLFGMPDSLYRVMSQVKVLEDDKLAAALQRVLSAARRDGRLAHFPDLYLFRLYEALHEPSTGAKPASAEVVYRAMRALEGADSPIDYFLEQGRVTDLTQAGRFQEAVEAQRRAVRILARRGHGDRDPALWRMQRARLDAVEGGLFASRGLAEQARASYRKAVLHAPNDPNVLNTVAWQRALAGFELNQAESEARRATNLEARVDNRPTLHAADTLAYVLLKLGRPEEAATVLAPRIDHTVTDGLIHLHMGQIHAAAGRLGSAWAALVEALTWDRTLADAIAEDPYLKAFREGDRMRKLLRAAAENRVKQGLE